MAVCRYRYLSVSVCCRYFSLQATEPLGMEDKVRIDIEMGICDERGPQADSFLSAQQIAYDRMNEACTVYTSYTQIVCQH